MSKLQRSVFVSDRKLFYSESTVFPFDSKVIYRLKLFYFYFDELLLS